MHPPKVESCESTAQPQSNEKAYIFNRNPEPGNLASRIRQNLYDRRAQLRDELNLVNNAINLAECDESVGKMMNALAAAKI